MITPTHQQRVLGASEIVVPALGLGTNRWKGSRSKPNDAFFATYQAYIEAGANFFDTAELYTGGNSERLLGECMRRDMRPVIVATKFAPWPTRLSPHALMDALDASLDRLGVESIDLYYVHWPYTLLNIDALMDMMALAVHTGKIRAIGVSNYSAKQMRQAAARLARYNLPLAANEVHYSLLHRKPETNGVLEACRELNVALVAWRPLESGRLQNRSDLPALESAKQGETAVEQASHKQSNKQLKQEQLVRLQQTLQQIALARGRSVSQVALNWLLCRDERVIPIPGATSTAHLQDNLATLEWELNEDEFDEISKASAPWKK